MKTTKKPQPLEAVQIKKTIPGEKIKMTIILNDDQKREISQMIGDLQAHKSKYFLFDSFIKVDNDALNVAHALLNNDYKTFKKYKLKYTKHTAEKMRGIDSLSTYKKYSDVCKFLQHGGGICSKCYADKSISLYKAALLPTLIYNTLLLKYIDIDADQIPYINSKYFRFESFSDLQSSKHFKNLLTICKKNKCCLFTLWSKCGYKLTKYMEAEKILKLPNNLNIVFSEYYINKKTEINYLKQLQACLYPQQAITGNYKNALKCFVVYDDEKKRKESNLYQCKNSCINCLKCYKKSKNIIYIAEKIH